MIVVALLAIVVVATVPALRPAAPSMLEAAAAEAGNVLRFALNEAKRTGGYLVVDANSPGQLRVHASNASGAVLDAVNDPLTKAPLNMDTSKHPWSGQVRMTAQFMQGGTPYTQLLIGPAGQLSAVENGITRGPLQTGSNVVFSSGALSATVAIHETTGRIAIQ